VEPLTADEIRQANPEIVGAHWDGFGKFEDLTDKHKWQYINDLNDDLTIPLKVSRLTCHLYQRSADVFLGVPFNIASYGLLLLMIAQVTNTVAHELVWTGGDCHLYSNHMEQVNELLSREPLPLCKLHLNPAITNIFDFTYADITVSDYQHHPAIKAPVAV
jgi:thymidylate synthase